VTRPLGGIDPRLYKVAADSDDDDYDPPDRRSAADRDIYDPPDNHIGRVWFGVKYESQSEKLLVTLVKAKHLAGRGNVASGSSSSSGDFFVR